jgi:hypothetical protein
MFDFIVDHYNYWTYIGLMIIGFYAMMTKRNLIKKIIGMNIFQSAIIFFFISSSVKPIAPCAHAHSHRGDGSNLGGGTSGRHHGLQKISYIRRRRNPYCHGRKRLRR